MLATRGYGPGVTLSTFGFGPSIAEVIGEVVQGLLASFFGINAALQAPVQLTALELSSAALFANAEALEALINAGLCDDTVSIEDALGGRVTIKGRLQSDEDPSIG